MNIRKIYAVLLSVVLAASALSICAFASGGTAALPSEGEIVNIGSKPGDGPIGSNQVSSLIPVAAADTPIAAEGAIVEISDDPHRPISVSRPAAEDPAGSDGDEETAGGRSISNLIHTLNLPASVSAFIVIFASVLAIVIILVRKRLSDRT